MNIFQKNMKDIVFDSKENYITARVYTSILCDTNSWTGELFYFSNFHDMYIFLLGYYSGLQTR